MFEVFGQNLLSKSALVKNMEAGARLELGKTRQKGKRVSAFIIGLKHKTDRMCL